MRIVKIKNDLIHYQKAHQNKTNEILHYFAFLFAFLGWIFLFVDVRMVAALALLHYVFSWIGHFYFEENKPASFKHPLLGFYAGYLWFFMRTGELLTRKKLLPSIDDEENEEHKSRLSI